MSEVLRPCPDYEDSAVAFLRDYGHTSLVSLGCGFRLNRIDNHIRLLTALNLTFYVGIDKVATIDTGYGDILGDREFMEEFWANYHQEKPRGWREAIKVFPNTWEEAICTVQ